MSFDEIFLQSIVDDMDSRVLYKEGFINDDHYCGTRLR